MRYLSHNPLRMNYIINFSRHVTLSFGRWFLVGRSSERRCFQGKKHIFLHSVDVEYTENVSLESCPCLEVNIVLERISFPEKMTESRICFFTYGYGQSILRDILKDHKSPVLLEILRSCEITVSYILCVNWSHNVGLFLFWSQYVEKVAPNNV